MMTVSDLVMAFLPRPPGFAMPAVIFGTDWGAAFFALPMKVAQNMTAYAAVTSQVAERSVG